jgi:hypothetical protein
VRSLGHQRGRPVDALVTESDEERLDPAIDPKRGSTRWEDVTVAVDAGITIGRRSRRSGARRWRRCCGSYGTSGWRDAAASISSFSTPS